MTTKSKREKLENALRRGRKLSTEQIVNNFGYASGGGARKDIHRIRENGLRIKRNQNNRGIWQYAV